MSKDQKDERTWHEGSWDPNGVATGLPPETHPDSAEEQYVWCVIELRPGLSRTRWGDRNVGPVRSIKTLLRSMSAFYRSSERPFPNWRWMEAEDAPAPPA